MTGRSGYRRVFLEVGLAAMWTGAFLAGCLDKQDLSADILTAVDDATPAGEGATRAQPAGAKANQAMLGESDPAAGSSAGSGSGGGTGSGTGNQALAVRTVGSGTAGSDTSGEGTAEGALEAHDHVDRPPGFGSDAAPEGAGTGAPVSSPETHPHVERPPGFGSTQQATNAAGGMGTGAPVATPEPHTHVERPPGYGSTMPAAPSPEKVPGPSAVGVAKAVSGVPDKVMPNVETPFERQYKGKKMVTVSGEISFDGKASATVDLDCFVPDKATAAGRKLVNKAKVAGPGPFTMSVPANFGPLIVTAFMDVKGDGPDRSDPQGTYEKNPIEIKDKNISHVNIILKGAAGSSR